MLVQIFSFCFRKIQNELKRVSRPIKMNESTKEHCPQKTAEVSIGPRLENYQEPLKKKSTGAGSMENKKVSYKCESAVTCEIVRKKKKITPNQGNMRVDIEKIPALEMKT